jgi:hypothetical protein
LAGWAGKVAQQLAWKAAALRKRFGTQPNAVHRINPGQGRRAASSSNNARNACRSKTIKSINPPSQSKQAINQSNQCVDQTINHSIHQSIKPSINSINPPSRLKQVINQAKQSADQTINHSIHQSINQVHQSSPSIHQANQDQSSQLFR